MKLSTTFVSLLAAVSSVAASPFGSADVAADFVPVPVTKLVCDGDTYRCTASLNYGDGEWVAQWSTSVFHQGLFGGSDHQDISGLAMAPVPVATLKCDGDSYKCTANLNYGDGKWVAQWPTNVFRNSAFGGSGHKAKMSMAPVPVSALKCDGDSYKCTADLEYGDGQWVAQWATSVFHRNSFLSQD